MNRSDVTGLLVAWSNGEESARGRVIEAVYGELRRLARAHLRRERLDHSLSPTALVHEAYLKLVDQRRVRWENRVHFFAIAAHIMRRILVDHARVHQAAKRGADARVALGFLAYLAASNPRTQFLIYSRGRVWRPTEAHAAWRRDVVARFPRLEGRLSTMIVPGRANATFRDPATAELLRTRVKEILRLP